MVIYCVNNTDDNENSTDHRNVEEGRTPDAADLHWMRGVTVGWIFGRTDDGAHGGETLHFRIYNDQ